MKEGGFYTTREMVKILRLSQSGSANVPTTLKLEAKRFLDKSPKLRLAWWGWVGREESADG